MNSETFEQVKLQEHQEQNETMNVIVSAPTFYDKKNIMYDHYYQGCKAIARDIPGNKSAVAYKQFALFKNALAVETYVRSLPVSERNLYEICLYSGNRSIRNHAVKLFIDVDITGEEWNEDKKQEYVESIYYKFHDVLESLYGIDYSHRNIRVVDSSGIIEKPSG